ncbi:MAG TPA: hypothetical protein VF762_05435 [Blastocatellia bacterium]|jgi:hypothetical protein
MDHEQIDQFDLIDRYLMGKLAAEEGAGFEEHFVDCPLCIARLQTKKSFLRDLRLVATEQTVQIDRHEQAIGFRQPPRTSFSGPVALAAVCLTIAAMAGAIFVLNHTRRIREQVSRAESSAEQWQRRYEEEHQSTISAEEKRQEMESQMTGQLRALEAKLKEAEARRARMEAELGRGTIPNGNLPFFILTSVRGGDLTASEAVNEIKLRRSSAMFAFSISLEGESEFVSYRITIFDDRHRLVWKSGRLTPDANDALSIILKQDLFRPGHYSLKVDGVKRAGGADAFGNYPFRIIKTP